ncbi:hypothetical protein [Sandaracinus amylolyticus]|uniref:Lipoprotein n=1 Tax=Sandaracinus amylolyticus TaxID=927083 RepID=A0A0F6W7R4_9BACT|nr:hypothetical protein [Sandaracinus amylolyticus]AKF09573.1 hypothetical protein DB32_006722 [Sandaracinus amylolyticus]
MRRSWLALSMSVAIGCGARSGLDVPDDAGADAADAAPFRSFPCRWFPGETVELPANDLAVRRTAAVSTELDRVAIIGRDPEDASVDRAFLLLPRATPALQREIEVPARHRGGLVPRPGGWLEAVRGDATSCELRLLTPSFDVERTLAILPATHDCAIDPIDLEHVVLQTWPVSEGLSSVISILRIDDGTMLEVSRGDIASATLDRDGHAYVVVGRERELEVRVVTREATELRAVLPARNTAWARIVPDRLLGGAILLYERHHERWALDRLRVRDGAIEREPIAQIDHPLSGAHDLATNETEALFSLRDGSFVAIPLHSGDVRVFDPPLVPGSEHQVVIAPGESAAGQLWIGASADGSRRLFYRSLTCNR